MKKLFICCITLFAGCHSQEVEESKPAKDLQPWLENQAEQRGIKFNWVSGESGEFNMPEIIGGGAAFIDFDNDGDLDIYFVQGGTSNSYEKDSNILLRNDNGFLQI